MTRSGNVGRTTLAYRPHDGVLISDDLLRVEPLNPDHWGWTYSFLRSAKCRAMMTAAQYGHVIKHLEVSHLEALPIPTVDECTLRTFNDGVRELLKKRSTAFGFIEEAERILDDAVGPAGSRDNADVGFPVKASNLFSGRRRLETAYHNPYAASILARFKKMNLKTEPLEAVTERIWWLTRFKRVFGEEGTPYMSADDLFSLNPTASKHVLSEQAENAEQYHIKAGWLVMACSGQSYGLLGSVLLATERHELSFFSHDLVRIAPSATRIRSGYLYAVLGHPRLGRPLVIRHAYGTSIPHLDPGDVATIPIVRLNGDLENGIADRMERAVSLRAEADELEDSLAAKAEQVTDDLLHGRVGTSA